MKKKLVIALVFITIAIMLAGCSSSQYSGTTNSTNSSTNHIDTITSSPTGSKPNSSSTSFTNQYGTPTTLCAHSGCLNYIASSGDTNCCTLHSHKCLECGKYIDEDATWCMDCLKSASSGSSSHSSGSGSSKGPWHSSNVKSDGMGPYPCYGKGNTCNNTTKNCLDLYCDSCDPDGDNKEN